MIVVLLLSFVFSCHGLLVDNLGTTRPQGQGEFTQLFSFQFTLVSFFILKVGLNTINKSINIFFIPMGMGDGSRVQPTEMSCAYQIADGVQPKQKVGGGEVVYNTYSMQITTRVDILQPPQIYDVPIKLAIHSQLQSNDVVSLVLSVNFFQNFTMFMNLLASRICIDYFSTGR